MRSTTCLSIAAAFLLGLSSADAAAAQDAAVCTYQTCALRLEARFFGSRIVRGATGESVVRLGPFGQEPSVLLNGSDSAAACEGSSNGWSSLRNGWPQPFWITDDADSR